MFSQSMWGAPEMFSETQKTKPSKLGAWSAPMMTGPTGGAAEAPNAEDRNNPMLGAWAAPLAAEPQKPNAALLGAWAAPLKSPPKAAAPTAEVPLAESQKPNTANLGAWAAPLAAPTGGVATPPESSVTTMEIVVRCTGLPFSATVDSVLDFFDELDLGDDAVHLPLAADGSPSGECFVTLGSEAALAVALERDRKVLGHRRVSVARHVGGDPPAAAASSKAAAAAKKPPPPAAAAAEGAVLRMRGLPYSATEADVAAFFGGLRVAAVAIGRDGAGRASGEARVEFRSEADATAALAKDKIKFPGTARYIELFRAKEGGGAAAAGGAAGGDTLWIKGLPFEVTASEVVAFFKAGGFDVAAGGVKLAKDGQGTARFASAADARQALAALNHQYCGSRYVELTFA